MRKIFRIQLLPARHGDAILVEYGDAASPARFLIDGGPLGAYAGLKARLEALPTDQREFELLVVTHIDGDHIEGALKLINDADLVRFRDIWFNGWRHLVQGLQEPVTALDEAVDAIDRSVLEGLFFGARIGDRPWNAAFGGGPIFVPLEGPLPSVTLPGGMKITLLSPRLQELKQLREAWDKALTRLALDPGDTQAIRDKLEKLNRFRSIETYEQRILDMLYGTSEAVGKIDDAAANGSSIAFVAEYEGKRCAFLGDAHAVPVEKALTRMAREDGAERVRLDAFKVAHHGSAGNIDPNVLARVRCSNYLVSTDGSIFNHPDDAAIAMIARRSPGAHIFFNHRSERTAIWDDARLREDLGYASARYPLTAQQGSVLDLLADAR